VRAVWVLLNVDMGRVPRTQPLYRELRVSVLARASVYANSGEGGYRCFRRRVARERAGVGHVREGGLSRLPKGGAVSVEIGHGAGWSALAHASVHLDNDRVPADSAGKHPALSKLAV
jgi:hypothetical protein